MTTVSLKMFCCFLYLIGGSEFAVSFNALPKDFVQCRISDIAFNECVRAGLQSAIPRLVMGVPSLDLLKIDPLRISTLGIEQGTRFMKIKLVFNDLDIINLRYLTIKKALYNSANCSMAIESEARKSIILEGLYEIDGKILVLPITGNGRCKISLDNFKLTGDLQMTPTVYNESVYLKIRKLSWKFTTTKLHIELDNLFHGDRVLGDHMNTFLNENWRVLLDELQSSFEEGLGLAFKKIIQKFFDYVPLNQIFID